MATINNDGSFNGKHGNSVYYTRKGKKIVRTYVPHKPSFQPKQLIQRAKLRAVSSFLKPFKKVIGLGYQGPEGYSTPMNEAISWHIKLELLNVTPPDSEEPVYELQPEEVKLSRGNIEPPHLLSISRINNQLTLTWDNALGPVPNRANDNLALTAYTPGTPVFANYHVGTRESGNGSATMPLEFTEAAHLWIFYWNGQKNNEPGRENVSDSVYLGVV